MESDLLAEKISAIIDRVLGPEAILAVISEKGSASGSDASEDESLGRWESEAMKSSGSASRVRLKPEDFSPYF